MPHLLNAAGRTAVRHVMAVIYLCPSSRESLSGGTRKLYDHTDILTAHGIPAEVRHLLPPATIPSGPENLFVIPEVYGEYLIDAVPRGVPRVAIVQNAYLLDFDDIAPPGDPHPLLRCEDLVAVLVESEHTKDRLLARFPDLPCPVFRFHPNSTWCDGPDVGQRYGAWPRARAVTYFEYKRQDLNKEIFGDLELPAGWELHPMAKMTDAEVAHSLRTSAIFAAPITHEGLCATTQEALVAGAVIVGWPGGPSKYIPSGWPASTPVAESDGNVTVGGPMEYLAGIARIAPQDDVAALRELIVDTASAIERDPSWWAAMTAEAARWHREQYSSRSAEIDELVAIFGEIETLAAHHRRGGGRTRLTGRPAEPSRILVHAAELVSDPGLARTYATGFSEADPVELVVYGPGLDPRAFEAELRGVAGSVGLDLEHGPAIRALIPAAASATDELVLVANCAAVLSDRPQRPPFDQLRRVAPGLPATLKAALAPSTPANEAGAPEPVLVSVVVAPSLNERVDTFVESVLAQSEVSVELVVVEPSERLDGFASSFDGLGSQVRVLRSDPGLDRLERLRTAIESARGTFVLVLEGADRLRPGALARMVEVARANPECAAVTATRATSPAPGVAGSPASRIGPLVTSSAVVHPIALGDVLLAGGLDRLGSLPVILCERASLSGGAYGLFGASSYPQLAELATLFGRLLQGPIACLADELCERDGSATDCSSPTAAAATEQVVEWLSLAGLARQQGFLADAATFASAVAPITARLAERLEADRGVMIDSVATTASAWLSGNSAAVPQRV